MKKLLDISLICLAFLAYIGAKELIIPIAAKWLEAPQIRHDLMITAPIATGGRDEREHSISEHRI